MYGAGITGGGGVKEEGEEADIEYCVSAGAGKARETNMTLEATKHLVTLLTTVNKTLGDHPTPF